MAENRIIASIIGKLLSMINAMRIRIIVIIVIIVEKMDIRTKKIFDIVILSRVYIILFMTIMTIICHWLMVLFDNRLGNNDNKGLRNNEYALTIDKRKHGVS